MAMRKFFPHIHLYRNGNPTHAARTLPMGFRKKPGFGKFKRLRTKEKSTMLWTLFVILLIAWLIGLIGFHVVAWYIHVLLVLALVVLIIQLISGRRGVV
jgi:Flp pilus assembly protein TadB